MTYDTFVMVDWSGGNDRGATPTKDAIWACIAGQDPIYFRNRQLVETWLADLFGSELAAGRRVLAGFDFPFGYPAGFAKTVTGSDDPLALWAWFNDNITDTEKSNNRFDIAAQLNALSDGIGPFWANGLQRDIPLLPRKGNDRTATPFTERRAVEGRAKGSFTCWQMAGAGAVGSQVMMGMPVLHRLRETFAPDVAVWPFEAGTAAITLVEIWPTLFAGAAPMGMIKDAHQVQQTANILAAMDPQDLAKLMDVTAPEEGWILGVPQPKAPALRNDCFAMPQGAYWTPVDDALGHLRDHLTTVTGTQTRDVSGAVGRTLAQDVIAKRAHPPTPNSAVDGYGFVGPLPDGPQSMPLVTGRAAAGAPYPDTVPKGHAVRVLTGAALPDGVDTVVLQEDVTLDGETVLLNGPLKRGANARSAGEDMTAGQTILRAGRVLTPADLGMLTTAGVGSVQLHKKLRVGMLSTGDELIPAGGTARPDQIYDANRPMLCAIAKSWGHKVIDLGCAPDDRAALREMLADAAQQCDVILTSGGASAGDEDHMSALLQDTGSLALWRIAMKPGRPLAMGLWDGTPVLGLPGNPVAAMVCALVFARPALDSLAGRDWSAPIGYDLPAAFTKSKKAGRREYIRARVRDGKVEAFGSEGSGRVSGLSWADGLVELGDDAMTINHGDLVRFIPFSGFGL
ncbi:MAG: gephyrin-like molybdotransferase Glp [Yoonia sp.]